MTTGEPIKVLCLDGGGMRGVYQAAFLEAFAQRVANSEGIPPEIDVGKAFDLIVGTSTGGIIACALASGKVSLSDTQKLYKKAGPEIFPYQGVRSIPFIGGLIRALGVGLRQGNEGMRETLFKHFGKTTVGEVYQSRGIALAIPTVDLNRHAAVVFKTKHLGRLSGRDDTRTLVDVCMATTAAPIVRSIAELEEPGGQHTKAHYVDGGLWANNPGMVGMVEAIELANDRGESGRPIALFMLGTLPSQGGEEISRLSQHRGAWGWKAGLRALTASLNSQAVGYDYLSRKMAELRNDGSFALRIPAQCPSNELRRYLNRLDDARPKVLHALARQANADADYAWSQVTHSNPELGILRDALATAPQVPKGQN